MAKIDFTKIVKPYYKNAVIALEELIKINSVYDQATISTSAPYGKGVKKALNYIAELGELFGFEVDRCDNYLSELTFGKGDKLISVFAHADVVPSGHGWEQDPFIPFYKKGCLYGRGATDDKGPLMAAFYAIKALKDNNLINNYRVRLVVGGDEERGSSCLKYYFEQLKKEQPTFGFTPDATFPLVYGEKGITNFISEKNINLPEIVSLKEGLAFNSVFDQATLQFLADEQFAEFLKKTRKIETKVLEQYVMEATFSGVSAHGSMPEKGKNAGLLALEAYAEFYQNKEIKKLISLFKDFNGKPFGGFKKGKNLGLTTYNLGVIEYQNKTLTLKVNFRYPEKTNVNECIKNFDLASGFTSKAIYDSPPLLFSLKSKLVKTLLNVYRDESDDKKTKPITMGGGTYAKNAENTIAFGPAFPYEVNNIHNANEFINIKNFELQMIIYARAIYELGNLK